MFDQVPPARSHFLSIRQELVHHIELMEPRPDLNRFLLSGLLILCLDDLRIVLENVREPGAGEDALPKIVGLEAVRVRRIPRTVVPTQIERQEPQSLTLEMRAKADLVVVHSKMHNA